MTFSPVRASKQITQEYGRYLSTIFSLEDRDYQRQFENCLKRMPFAAGPYLEVTDAFEKGETIRELIDTGILPQGFERLNFRKDRPLYRHQADSLKQIAKGKNVVVCTGTGSGKTESFLLPIMRTLVEENNEDKLAPGVRAMLIYPMNALANDQIERLRELLAGFPEITFGCYTGQTEETYKKALVNFKKLNNDELPLENELISRQQMKESPPNILITNYAMLEYLMVRPDDSVFFSPRYTHFWKYIVLDEAHVYRGSTGIEVAMLLRRLNARLNKRDIQYILTSATLGGEEDNEGVACFAQNLCNSTFSADDVIRAKRIQQVPPISFEKPPERFYKEVSRCIDKEQQEDDILQCVLSFYPDEDTELREALYSIIYRDPFFWEIRSHLQKKPQTVQNLAILTQKTEEEITEFVTVATRAVHDGGKLFDARYHMFLRAAESVYITLEPSKKLFLEGRRTFTENGQTYKVFEAAVCAHCHSLYLLGKESNQGILEQEAFVPDEEPRCVYLVSPTLSNDDEDEEHTLEDAGEKIQPFDLCPICGMLTHAGATRQCDHEGCPPIRVQRIKLESGRSSLTKCPKCENTSSNILRRFFVGQEAVTSVIGTSLFETLPSYTVEYKKPAITEEDFWFDEEQEDPIYHDVGAKQFLTFSDSRQAAAFYASYMDQTYKGIVYKRLIVETLKKKEYVSEGKTLDECVKDLEAMFEVYNMAKGQSVVKEAWKAALHEAVDNNGLTSLCRMGMLAFDIPNDQVGMTKVGLSSEEVHTICALFSQWMLSEAAIHYPEPMNLEDRSFFAPNGIEHSYTFSDADPQMHTLSFVPSKRGCSNKRVDYFRRVLQKKNVALSEEEIDRVLDGIWKRFFAGKNGVMKATNGEYRISSEKVIVRRPEYIFQCRRCRRLTTFNIAGVCPAYHCNGELVLLSPDNSLKENHYYKLYQTMEIRPLRIREHTAQLSREMAYEYQNEFKQKKIDILSCSTTFEMGVDVGSLETVFMRNVPPSPANYAQRAGRAGRSLCSAAYALTFCNKSSHDFTFFRHPEEMIKGRIDPPVFDVRNEKIAIRHVYASAFGQFWKERPEYFSTVEAFLSKAQCEKNGIDCFEDYLRSSPEILKNYLREFLPADLAKQFRIDEFGWIDALVGENGKLRSVAAVYEQDIEALQNARETAYKKGIRGVDMLSQRIRVYQQEGILAYLARANIFPKYGFPVDTVEMTIVDRNGELKNGLQLQRDLSMAISEYAPDSQVVANGKLITSRYIRKSPNKSWRMYSYDICDICHNLNTYLYIPGEHVEENEKQYCQNCGGKLSQKHKGVYLIPEFGFIADGNIKKPGLRKPVRTFKGEVSYIGSRNLEEETLLQVGAAKIYVRSSKSEEMAVLNRGQFYVCEQCGYTKLEKCYLPIIRDKKKHERAAGGECTNKELKNYALGYRFKTDILSMRFVVPTFANGEKTEDEALSILYGILEGASRELSIEREDISGCLNWFFNQESRTAQCGFILYDKTPGGAGHVRRLADPKTLEKVFDRTFRLMNSCTCGGESMDTSCYSCLRNYYNQKYHDRLQRGYVVNFLKKILF